MIGFSNTDSGRSTTAPAPVFNLSDHLKADPVGDLQSTHYSIRPSCISALLNSKDFSAPMAVHSKTDVQRFQLRRVFLFFAYSALIFGRQTSSLLFKQQMEKVHTISGGLSERWKEEKGTRRRQPPSVVADYRPSREIDERRRIVMLAGQQKSCVTLFRASNSFT